MKFSSQHVQLSSFPPPSPLLSIPKNQYKENQAIQNEDSRSEFQRPLSSGGKALMAQPLREDFYFFCGFLKQISKIFLGKYTHKMCYKLLNAYVQYYKLFLYMHTAYT